MGEQHSTGLHISIPHISSSHSSLGTQLKSILYYYPYFIIIHTFHNTFKIFPPPQILEISKSPDLQCTAHLPHSFSPHLRNAVHTSHTLSPHTFVLLCTPPTLFLPTPLYCCAHLPHSFSPHLRTAVHTTLERRLGAAHNSPRQLLGSKRSFHHRCTPV